MRIWIIATCTAAAFWALGASSAAALTIDCATRGDECVGGTYELTIVETDPNEYLATYEINTSGLKVDATHLVDIEFKAANDYTNPMIVSGSPMGTLESGPLSGGGCNGNNDGFICVSLDPKLSADGSTYTWQVQFGATGLLDESEWHIGARYTSADHQKGWLISETGGSPPIPEPGAAMVFGVGMLVAGRASMRRRALA
ncbi:MAG: hypothetical protein JRF61_18885 [Deltaproteobacteria bacterium]|jgi:hypothetical protein|nr:hypothetical protein [Deltaproteobacteria bacterium]